MHLTYKARYYNGQASRPFVADVSIHTAGIDISYQDEKGDLKIINWLKESVIETHFSSSHIIMRYGSSFPYQQLEVTDQDFIREYKTFANTGRVKRWLHFSSFGMVGVLLGGFLVSIVLGYFFVLPLVADHIANNFPIEYEIEMGTKMYDNILSTSEIDSTKTAAINHFFKTLNIDSKYPIRITVVKDSVVNAFAVPGGGIIVYDAIIKPMKTPEELAALLSHEYSHIELKHATRNVFRSLAGYLFISIIFSDANGLANLVIDNANQLQNLSYSRELEHEADENGLAILQANRINPEGMIDLFKTLKAENKIQVNEIISTHPDLENRILFVQEFAKEHPYQPKQNDSLVYYFKQLQSEW
jgi:Zn-dependent protease with chaperone function